MRLSKRRILGIAGIGIPLLVIISALAIWGFSVEISFTITASAAFSLTKPILAFGTLLVGGFMALVAPGARLPSPPLKGHLISFFALMRSGFIFLMVLLNSLCIMLAANHPPLIFTISAWAALVCLVGFFPATIAYALVYAAQRRAAGLAAGGGGLTPLA